MGFFSWLTSDQGKSIRNKHTQEGATPCKLLDDKGNYWKETDYDGYGDFHGVDYYALVDTMNGGDGDRDLGIKMAFSGDQVKLPKLVSINCKKPYEDLPDSPICPDQGYW